MPDLRRDEPAEPEVLRRMRRRDGELAGRGREHVAPDGTVAVLREGKTLDEASLQAWIGERVVKWMIPDRVIFVDAIPRTGVGKFLKRDLREQYKDLLGGA